MILSYHLLPEFILFTHKLEPVTSLLSCVCCFLVCLVLVLCVFVFLFFVWWFLVFWLLCFVLRSGDECDSTQDYVAVLHQFTFEATPPQAAHARLN